MSKLSQQPDRTETRVCLLLIALTLQIQSGKCCALGELLTKLWSAMQIHYACTARVVLVIHIDHNLIRNSPSAQHFPL